LGANVTGEQMSREQMSLGSKCRWGASVARANVRGASVAGANVWGAPFMDSRKIDK